MKTLTKSSGETASVTSAPADIASVLQVYETALNASDVDTVMTVFASDGVFMAPNSPSMIGADAIQAAYAGLFQAITFETELQIEEIEQVATNWAFVRTSSVGFVTVHALGERVADANHELFVFQKGDDDRWKIARYCFSTTNPLRQ